MPHIFVDDGYPEASEYANNYVWYDASDPTSLERALAEAELLKGRREGGVSVTPREIDRLPD
jgi:hypothetical protein